MIEEYWKDIEGYEGLYQISTLGKVKSLKYNKEKILKPGKDTNGYLMVVLCKNGKQKECSVHRLVAQTFIHNPNSEHYTQVNHIDENKTNNTIENLEWCTSKYNSNYGSRIERISKSKSKPVIGINKINGYIVEYQSATEVERCLGISQKNITTCCKGKRNSAGGYRWFYKNNKEGEQND